MHEPKSAHIPIAAPPPLSPEVEAATQPIAVLNEIVRIATLELGLQPVLQRITDALAGHFEWELVALALVHPDTGTFVCEAVTSSVPTLVEVGYTRPLGTGVVGEVAARRQAVLIDDVRIYPNFVDTTPGVLSELCVPVLHKGELVAVLNIESTRLAAFQGQLQILQAIADQIAGTIASARMYEELKQRARLMEMMSEVSRTALKATNLDGFLNRVARYIHECFPLEIVSILLHDAERGQFVAAAYGGTSFAKRGERWPVARGIVGRCIRQAKTQIVPDVKSDSDYININSTVVAELVVPIRHRNEVLGVFNVESRSADIFTPANILAFEMFADQIAGALRLVRANEDLAVANAKVEQQTRDLQIANEALTGMVEKFHAWSAHDSLTALYNRSHFDKVFPVEWRRAARSRVPLSLILADIDRFKEYNDANGHLAGDECLRSVAEAIAETVHRAADVVTRYGGEEFAVLLPYTDRESAMHIAETIRRRIESMRIDHPTSPSNAMTISIGVATVIPDGDEQRSRTLIEAADRALYAAKRAGRNRVVAHE